MSSIKKPFAILLTVVAFSLLLISSANAQTNEDIEFNLISSSYVRTDYGKDSVEFTFNFEVTALNGDVYLSKNNSLTYNLFEENNIHGFHFVVRPGGDGTIHDSAVTVVSLANVKNASDSFLIEDGQTGRFKAVISIYALKNDSYKIQFGGFQYGENTSADKKFILDDVVSDFVYIKSSESNTPIPVTPTPSESLNLLTPNGKEKWVIGSRNVISWTPEPHSTNIEAYLYKKSGRRMTEVGKILESAKGSIVWFGDINNFGEYPKPGSSYFVKIVNKLTGESDFSDKSFTILPVDTLKVNIKPGDKDGLYKIGSSTNLKISWSTKGKFDSCYLIQSGKDGSIISQGDVAQSGTKNIFVELPNARGTNAGVGEVMYTAITIDCNGPMGSRRGVLEIARDDIEVSSAHNVDAPTLTSLSKTTAKPGDRVLLTGTNILTSGENKIFLTRKSDGTVYTYSSSNKGGRKTAIYFTVPKKMNGENIINGDYTLHIQTAYGTSNALDISITGGTNYVDPDRLFISSIQSASSTVLYVGGGMSITGNFKKSSGYTINYENKISGLFNQDYRIVKLSDTLLYTNIPPAVSTGMSLVTVLNGSETSNSLRINVAEGHPHAQVPAVYYIQAKAAEKNEFFAGETIVVYGSGMSDAKVYLVAGVKTYRLDTSNINSDSLKILGDNQPSLPDGTYQLYTERNGVKSNVINVKYINTTSPNKLQPTLSSLSNPTVKPGARVLLTGTNILTSGANNIIFTNKETGATYTYSQSKKGGKTTAIYFPVPKKMNGVKTPNGIYTVTLRTAYGTSNSLDLTIYDGELDAEEYTSTSDSSSDTSESSSSNTSSSTSDSSSSSSSSSSEDSSSSSTSSDDTPVLNKLHPTLTSASKTTFKPGERILLTGTNILTSGTNNIDFVRKSDGAKYTFSQSKKGGRTTAIYFPVPLRMVASGSDPKPGIDSVYTTNGDYTITLRTAYGTSNSLDVTVNDGTTAVNFGSSAGRQIFSSLSNVLSALKLLISR